MVKIAPPPVNDALIDKNTGKLRGVWDRWFKSIHNHAKGGVSGSFTTVDGKTVTVVDGVITAITTP